MPIHKVPFFLIVIMIVFAYCVTAIIFTEGLSQVNDPKILAHVNTEEGNADQNGYLIRIWLTKDGNTAGAGWVEPQGFLSFYGMDITRRLVYIEQDAAKAPRFFINYHDTNPDQIIISSNIDGALIDPAEGNRFELGFINSDNRLHMVRGDPKNPLWQYQMATVGATQQLYKLTSEDKTSFLGFVSTNFTIHQDGNYAFSVCDNYVPVFQVE